MSTTDGERMTAKRAATRQKLLEATLAVIGEKGLHGVSVDGVAKRIGVTKGAVYDSFESKDAMIVAALALLPPEATAPFIWPTGRSGSVKSRLRRLGEAIYEGRGDVTRSALGAAEFQLYALTHPDMRARLSEIVSMGPSRTRAQLLELFEESELPMPVDAFVLLIHSVVPGLNQYRASAPKPPSRETVLAMFENLRGAE